MVNILGFNVNLPQIGGGASKLSLGLILLIVLIVLIIAVIIYLIYESRIYNKKIIVFENISGQGFQPVFRDKARLIKLGDGGEELLFLKKKKVYRTAYGRKMGINTYWFVIGQDGYWYNSVLGDFDAKMGLLDIEPIDRDMRYAHVAIRKNIQERYNKKSFLDQYAGVLITGIFLIIVVVAIWIVFKQIHKLMPILINAMETARDVMSENARVLSMLDSVKGGGLVPA